MTAIPTRHLLAIRTPGFHGRRPAPDEQLARQVRALVDNPPIEATEGGPLWHDSFGTDRTGWVLRRLHKTRAWSVFGEHMLTAAARRPTPMCCAFSYAVALAVRYGDEPPRPTLAIRTLLGDPCQRCQREIDDEAAARDVAAGRSARSRPTATTSAVTASAAPVRASPRPWWERAPDRVPTEVEDRQFLNAMARRYPRGSR